MKRKLQAARPADAGYPTLRALLGLATAAPLALAATTALADASVPDKPPPPPSTGDPQQPQPKPPEVPIHLGGKVACPRAPKEQPAPKPQKKRDPDIRMKGQWGFNVRPPEAATYSAFGAPSLRRGPSFAIADILDGEGVVIHPHGPDEPCHPRGRST